MSAPDAPLTNQQTAEAEARALHEGYLHRALVGLDQLVNVLTDGKPDMTISARAALAAQHGSTVGKALTDFFGLFQKDHGPLAVAGDDARATAEAKTGESSGVIDAGSSPSS